MLHNQAFLIEQEAGDPLRFRLTFAEGALEVKEVQVHLGTSVYHNELYKQLDAAGMDLRNRIKEAAFDKLLTTDEYRWVVEEGGEATIRKFVAPYPNIVKRRRTMYNRHYRAGVSVTFKARADAMRFQLQFMKEAVEA